MRDLYQEYKNNIKDLLNNKIYVFSIIIVAMLSYGFTITNFSVGIDDLGFDRYVTGTYILSAGRWGTTALYTIFQIFSFTPFWLELIVTLLTIITGIIFTAFLKIQLSGKIKNIHCIIATSILISYPILHQSFIYQSTNLSVIISNLALMIIPIVLYENFTKNKDFNIYLLIAIILPFFISMYESCCQTYILMTFIIAFIKIYNTKNDKEVVKKNIKFMLAAIATLVCGLIITFFISSTIKIILKNNGMLQPDHSSKGIPWLNLENNVFKSFQINVLNKLYSDFMHLSHVRNFIVLSILSLIITVMKSIKEKNYILIPLMIAIILSNFIINILQIKVLYRVDTSWSLAISFFTVFLLITIRDKTLNNILSILFCIIILLQTKQMNQFFYNDYIRYKKEANYAYFIANEVINKCEDTTKPLVYLYKKNDGTHQNQTNQDNGWSLIDWSSWAFNEPGSELTKFINSLGYNFTVATNEQRKEVRSNITQSDLEIIYDENVYETDKYIIILINYNI